MKCFVSILYGLLVIGIGLARTIDAGAFKPNAFWFCLTMGLLAIAAGFAYRRERRTLAAVLALPAAGIVLAFYLNEFITEAATEANYRVALAILASIGQLAVVLLPGRPATGK